MILFVDQPFDSSESVLSRWRSKRVMNWQLCYLLNNVFDETLWWQWRIPWMFICLSSSNMINTHGSFNEHHCSIAAEIAKFLSRLVWNWSRQWPNNGFYGDSKHSCGTGLCWQCIIRSGCVQRPSPKIQGMDFLLDLSTSLQYNLTWSILWHSCAEPVFEHETLIWWYLVVCKS